VGQTHEFRTWLDETGDDVGVDEEVGLVGGRVTRGVVRVGETVRRPAKRNSAFVRRLLAHLEERGFDAAPRYLGTDELGRETFSYLPGDVPPDLDAAIPDAALAHAARLIRRFHDATAGSTLAGKHEVACHGDLSPCNFVFRDGVPIGIIDFDAAAPGTRLEDLGYALFLWLNVGTDGAPLAEQARRIQLFCDAYGIATDVRVVDAIRDAVAANLTRLRVDGRAAADIRWWQQQLDWLDRHRDRLVELVAD
jgi:Ser/Thr protein kinase RdoA (MazF antagonist)